MENLTTLLCLRYEKHRQFQEAADSLARLEGNLAGCQERIETAITSYMRLHKLTTLVVHSPYLPVEEAWLCRDIADCFTMIHVTQIQAGAIEEMPF